MRKINFHPSQQIVEPVVIPPAPPIQTPIPITQTVQTSIQTRAVQVRTRTRVGNGHVSEMTRKITEPERVWLKNKFLMKNGQIENDDCVGFKAEMSDTIAIFQITGYISVLHRYVALGRLQLQDLSQYLDWMHIKYKGLWNQYTSERFRTARATNERARQEGHAPVATIPIAEVPIQTMAGEVIYDTPEFVTVSRRASYYK